MNAGSGKPSFRVHCPAHIHTAFDQEEEAPSPFGGPSTRYIDELADQLASWRDLLPFNIRWSDDDRFAEPILQQNRERPQQPLFSITPSCVSDTTSIHLSMVVAQLRTRYYYTKFIIYRSFVYKALHLPEMMTDKDRQGATKCLQAAMLWPISMYPCCERKRLTPVLFAWTQNFLGVLIVLRMIQDSPALRDIAMRNIDENEYNQTVRLLLHWMTDIKLIDGIADWGWRILRHLYPSVDV